VVGPQLFHEARRGPPPFIYLEMLIRTATNPLVVTEAGLIEITLTLLIVWYAWTWPKEVGR
jgi:hypothetical protein